MFYPRQPYEFRSGPITEVIYAHAEPGYIPSWFSTLRDIVQLPTTPGASDLIDLG